MTRDAGGGDRARVPGERARFSALDAVLQAPLAAPFFLLPLGLLVWGIARLAVRYVDAVRFPAPPVAWWQWPWGWPGPRVVETLHTALGGLPVSDLSPSGPWPRHMSDAFEVAGRALMALSIDGLVALLPLIVALWTIAAVLAVAAVRARTKARWSA